MEWMSAIDSSFLHIENDATPMHIGGVSIFAGPPPPFAELKQMVAGKLDLVPRYRQKVRFVPLAAGPPVWIDDPHFSLNYHLRHTAVPAPGSDVELRQMAARIFSQHLDRNKPLWELWVVEGLDEGRWALLSKVHHCMVDGVAATDLMSVMFSDDSSGSGAGVWTAAPEPSGLEILARSLVRRASPAGQVQALQQALGAPARDAPIARGDRTRDGLCGRQPASDRRLLADRTDRPAPALELGANAAVGREDRARRARRHGQRRCPDADHAGLPLAARSHAVSRSPRDSSCARWSPCRCADAARKASTTIASPRSSRVCRWGSATLPSVSRTSAPRWTASRSQSRPSLATC